MILAWYFSRDRQPKPVIETITDELEEDRNYWTKVRMEFSIPFFAETGVKEDE